MYKGMRKGEFFTAWLVHGKVTAVLVHGYFDNNYYYYKDSTYYNLWHAIEPISGKSVCCDYLLRNTMQKAMDKTQAAHDKIQTDYEKYLRHCAIFRASENEKTL